MALDTYANLKTAITDHLDRDDLSTHVDDFIDIAESWHKRDIRIRQMLTRASITINSEFVSLPSGCLEVQSLRILTTPTTVLTYMDAHELMRFKQDGTGTPSFYTINGDEFEFDVNPDSSYSGEIVYYAEETALSDANTSNNLLARAPDAYLYGALLASAPFLMNDERIAVWGSLYEKAVTGLSNMRRQDRHVGPLISRTAGSTP